MSNCKEKYNPERNEENDSPLKEFMLFFSREATLACDHLTSVQLLKQNQNQNNEIITKGGK